MGEITQYGPGFLKAKEEACERSDNTCQSCGKKGESLQGHHWAPRRNYPSDNEVTSDDLTALCPLCHAAISRIRELLAKDNSREDIQKAFEQAKDDSKTLEGLRRWIKDANSKKNGMTMDNKAANEVPVLKDDSDPPYIFRMLTESLSTEIQTNARQRARIEELERANRELEVQESKRKDRVRMTWIFVLVLVLIFAAVSAWVLDEYLFAIGTTLGNSG